MSNLWLVSLLSYQSAREKLFVASASKLASRPCHPASAWHYLNRRRTKRNFDFRRKIRRAGKILSFGFSERGNSSAHRVVATAEKWLEKLGKFDQQVDMNIFRLRRRLNSWHFWLLSLAERIFCSFRKPLIKVLGDFETYPIIVIAATVVVAVEVINRCQRGVVFHGIRVHECVVYQRIVQSHYDTIFDNSSREFSVPRCKQVAQRNGIHKKRLILFHKDKDLRSS